MGGCHSLSWLSFLFFFYFSRSFPDFVRLLFSLFACICISSPHVCIDLLPPASLDTYDMLFSDREYIQEDEEEFDIVTNDNDVSLLLEDFGMIKLLSC